MMKLQKDNSTFKNFDGGDTSSPSSSNARFNDTRRFPELLSLVAVVLVLVLLLFVLFATCAIFLVTLRLDAKENMLLVIGKKDERNRTE